MQRRASPIAGVGVVVAALGLVALAWSGVSHAGPHPVETSKRFERPRPPPELRAPRAGRQAAALLAGRPIDINDATVDELMLLPRIGPTLAHRIVDDRRARGPYARLDDLARRVSGIGPKTVARLRGLAEAKRDPSPRNQ